MVTSKLLWNIVVFNKNARHCTTDMSYFYLATQLDCFEYVHVPARLIPDEFMDLNNSCSKIKDGCVSTEIRKGIHGLPQAGILANKLLRKRVEPFGCHEVKHVAGLWKHKTRPITFTNIEK